MRSPSSDGSRATRAEDERRRAAAGEAREPDAGEPGAGEPVGAPHGGEHGPGRRRRRRRRGGSPPPGEPPVSDTFFAAARRLAEHLLELRIDALRLFKARRDRIQVRARAVAFQAATLGVLAVFGVVVLAAAAWLFLHGLSGALNALLGTPAWVGSLVVGLFVPLLAVLAIFLVRRRTEKRELKELMEEYRGLERRRSARTPEEPVP